MTIDVAFVFSSQYCILFQKMNLYEIVKKKEAIQLNKKGCGYPPNKFVIFEDSDQTPEELLALDHYVRDTFIVTLLQMLYRNSGLTSFDNWAADNAEEADGFFSEPYPDIAKSMFGYGNKKHRAMQRRLSNKKITQYYDTTVSI